MIYVLDTHTLVWYISNDPRLSATAQAVMDNSATEFVIPTMVLVEIQFLNAKKRFATDLSTVYTDFIEAKNCRVHPLDEDVVAQIPTGLDIHDAVITATALVYCDILQQPVTLITKDIKITQSGLIQTLW
jgi:PIN domain nuclease of toxin-antitoxin system